MFDVRNKHFHYFGITVWFIKDKTWLKKIFIWNEFLFFLFLPSVFPRPVFIPTDIHIQFLNVVCLFSQRYIPLWLYFSQPGIGLQPPRFGGFVITHNDAPQSVGLRWTNDQSVAETSTCQHTTLTTDKHPCPQWDSNPQSQQDSGRRPTPQTALPLRPAVLKCQ